MYNFASVDSVECVVLIAINWFGQSHVSSPEMTRIAKIAFCAFLCKNKKNNNKDNYNQNKTIQDKIPIKQYQQLEANI